MKPHPAQRFAAPSAIQHGVPLKELMDRRLVKLIGESLSDVVPGFDAKWFQSRASRSLKELELKDRALNIANAMAEQLPSEFDTLAPLRIRSLGPPLEATEDNGLAPLYYFPHAQLIATHGVSCFESGMLADGDRGGFGDDRTPFSHDECQRFVVRRVVHKKLQLRIVVVEPAGDHRDTTVPGQIERNVKIVEKRYRGGSINEAPRGQGILNTTSAA